jgi:preprotein translocase subunit SecG
MGFLKIVLILVEVLSSLLIVGLVLIQRSKSEGMGLAFGSGAGESLFGARAGNVLSRATTVLAIVFLVTTLLLGIIFSKKDVGTMDAVESDPAPAATQTTATPGLDFSGDTSTSTNQP